MVYKAYGLSYISQGLFFGAIIRAISQVKKLSGIAFRTLFPWSQLKQPNVMESIRMLEEDSDRRAQLGFTLNTYGMDLCI
jgi:hypothetical protein